MLSMRRDNSRSEHLASEDDGNLWQKPSAGAQYENGLVIARPRLKIALGTESVRPFALAALELPRFTHIVTITIGSDGVPVIAKRVGSQTQ